MGRALHLRDAAEQPELDSLDLNPVAACHHRVAELVQQDAGEEEQRTRQAEPVGGGWRDPGDLVRVIGTAEGPCDQRDDHQPKRMNADRNARQPADLEITAEHAAKLIPRRVPGIARRHGSPSVLTT